MMTKKIDHTYYKWPIRVYYEDTDAAGIVYYANYLKYMERARTELLRTCGFEQNEIKKQFNCIFVVRSAQVEYLQPAYFNDLLMVQTQVEGDGRLQITFNQTIINKKIVDLSNDSSINTIKPLVTGTIKIVCVNAQTFKPTRIPNSIKKVLISGN